MVQGFGCTALHGPQTCHLSSWAPEVPFVGPSNSPPLDATSVEHLFDLEIAPDLDMITPNLLAYFDYLFWFITQPNGSKSGPEDDIM